MKTLKNVTKVPDGYKIKDGYPKVVDGAIVTEFEYNIKDYHLMTQVANEALVIGFFLGDKFQEVGYIVKEGYCFILSNENKVNNYNLWRNKGMLVHSTPVKWKGKEYWIEKGYALRNKNNIIYHFDGCFAPTDVEDENIQRFKHNNKPILF